MPLRRLPANETASQRHVGKLVQLRNRIGIAADFAIEGIVQLSGRITANPRSSPKIGLCPDWPPLCKSNVKRKAQVSVARSGARALIESGCAVLHQ